uniref:PTS lactose/cellobiose transporter subunit IIA n=1 Tax=Staphylococcus epidermidis TaxID=1282 RepID=UPI0011A59041
LQHRKTNNLSDHIQINTDQLQLLTFQILPYPPHPPSKLLQPLNPPKHTQFHKPQQLLHQPNQSIPNAHKTQTNLLTQDAKTQHI